MIKKIFLIIIHCLILFLSVYAENDNIQFNRDVIQEHQQNIIDAFEIIKRVAVLSNDILHLDVCNEDDVAQKYDYLCAMMSRSLKQIKILQTEYNVTENFAVDITISDLLALQRYNRHYIKNMLSVMKNIPNSQDLQVSLTELFHRLHEVKKQIVLLDQTVLRDMYYIYAMLLFLRVILVQGLYDIQILMDKNIEQRTIMYQLFYFIEQLKHAIINDFMIKKGLYE